MFHYSFSPDPFDRRSLRQYAVVVFLPAHLENIVKPLRERYDADYNVIASHITVVFPFETSRSLDELSALIRMETQDYPSFDVGVDSIGDFYPESPIIYWAVESSPALTQLYCNLHTRLDLPLPFKRFYPHITVAKEISPHRLVFVKDRIVSYLPRERFDVRAIELVAPVADSSWVSVRTFPLKSD